jgi:cysteine-rich repeat protein
VKDSCGDEFIDPDEQCDGAALGGASCESLGYYDTTGVLACSATCELDVSDCGARCGDGTVDVAEDEECDGENFNGASCQSLGFGGGQLACTTECRRDLSDCSSVCGNGFLEGEETCDDETRQTGAGCDADCAIETGWTCDGADPSRCDPICSDGVALGTEVCDGSDLHGETCQSLDYYGGELACTDSCALDLTACEAAGWCGDGTLQDGRELCDGEVSAPETCVSHDFVFGGTLGCSEFCLWDESDCRSVVQLATGGAHACALLTDGTVHCWGDNAYGQLGDGTITNSIVPVEVMSFDLAP